MGELTTNRLWNNEPKDCPSQFARMILGIAAMPASRVCIAAAEAIPIRPADATVKANTRPAQARTLTPQLLPQTPIDRFTLCELVAADLTVLVAVCGALSLFSPAWGLALVLSTGFCGSGAALWILRRALRTCR